jgi:hypothetical protein
MVHGSDIIHLKDLVVDLTFCSIGLKANVTAQTCYLCSTPTVSLSYELLCRLELMTGLGTRCRATEAAEGMQMEEILTPMENRYLENS